MSRVLVIDDEKLVLEKAREALESVGLEVVTSDAPGLPDGVPPDTYDLVLLDVNMPDYFGDDLVGVLPELGVRAPVYLYSSIDERELRQLGRRAGAAGVISKSLTFAQVADEVLAILASHR